MMSNEFGYSKAPVKFDNVGRMVFSCRPGNYIGNYFIYAFAVLVALGGFALTVTLVEDFFDYSMSIPAILLALLIPTVNHILILIATFAVESFVGEGFHLIFIPLLVFFAFIAFSVYLTNNIFTRIIIYERAVRINNFFNDELVHFKNIRNVSSAEIDGKGTRTHYCIYIDSRVVWGSQRKVLETESLLVEALAKEELHRMRVENLTDYKRRWRW